MLIHRIASQSALFRGRSLILAALMLAGASGLARAQTVEELRQLLKERDAEIAVLRQRLSQAVGGGASAPQAGGQPQTALPAGERTPGPSEGSARASTAVAPDGKIAVDDDEINRALERALVERGDLLLPPNRFELQPALSYRRADGRSGFPRSDTLGTSLSLRAGLPWQSQIQMSIPYILRTRVGDEHAAGLGDVSLAVAKQLLKEGDHLPSLIAALGWTAPTGRDGFSGQVSLGSGFHTFGGSLTALKRLDPLVLVGGISYSASRSEQVQDVRITPGSVTGLRLASGLAISPDTSFDLGVNLSFVGETRIDGRKVPGSDDVVGTLDLGLGIVLSRQMFLRVGGQFRLTGPAPDVGLSVSLPIRF